jgi:DNA-binding MarR family transcriptional regulator
VRRPAVVVRHRVMAGLRAAGFEDLLPGHLAVFLYPGPEGQRPGVLAARAELSKQAMNHLLSQLERAGYLVREPDVSSRRSRVVRLTGRGHRVSEAIDQVVDEVDQAWLAALGPATYEELARSLQQLESVLGEGGALEGR